MAWSFNEGASSWAQSKHRWCQVAWTWTDVCLVRATLYIVPFEWFKLNDVECVLPVVLPCAAFGVDLYDAQPSQTEAVAKMTDINHYLPCCQTKWPRQVLSTEEWTCSAVSKYQRCSCRNRTGGFDWVGRMTTMLDRTQAALCSCTRTPIKTWCTAIVQTTWENWLPTTQELRPHFISCVRQEWSSWAS